MTTIPRPDTLAVNTARLIACTKAMHEADAQQDAESYVAASDLIDELLDQRNALTKE